MTPALETFRADALLALDKRGEAVRLFEDLARRSEGKWTAQARLRLASIDLQEGRVKECIRRCEQTWQEPPVPDVAALLRVWGAAYEQVGDNTRAARCFSGLPPE